MRIPRIKQKFYVYFQVSSHHSFYRLLFIQSSAPVTHFSFISPCLKLIICFEYLGKSNYLRSMLRSQTSIKVKSIRDHNEWNMFRDSRYFDFRKLWFLKMLIFAIQHFFNGPGGCHLKRVLSIFSFYPLDNRKRGKVGKIWLIS